eukprot:TRINITY_DN27_c0_g1_i4.p1 TRINITY_DN27_c0_g1~~TRINITY_DN27_c0_g1_i4.p1  ORF type:complete len:339 (+),score=103.77 TRINITY_DN27_c0_g1_i4:67-1083(+)
MLTAILVAALAAACAGEEWDVISTGLGDISAVSFSDATRGVATGLVLIYYTTDGGTTWADSNQLTTGSVRFQDTAASGQYFVVCGSGDTQWMPGCAYSSDYGVNFQKTDDTHLHDMWYSVEPITTLAGTFVKCGYWSDALKTGYGVSISANGGKSWTDHNWGLTEPPWYVSMYSLTAGYAAGGTAPINDTKTHALVAKTTDGSWSWKTVIDVTGDWYPGGISFISATTGWVVGVRSTGSFIMKTTDGGTTWTTQVTVDKVLLKNMKMFTSTEGFAVGGYEDGAFYHAQFLHTKDGGTTWISLSQRGVIPNNIDGISTTNVWASALSETGGGAVLKFVP